MKRLTVQKILQRYTKSRQDSPDSFYSWRETQVMMKNKYHSQPSYQFITHADDLEIALRPFQQARILGIDCETTGIDPHIDRVRLLQLAIPHQPVLVIDLFSVPETKRTPLRSLLTSNCLKVGHNLKFEWLMLTQAGLPLQLPFFDTYLAYRVLTAGLKKKLSLKRVTQTLLGVQLDKTEQTSDFTGTLTPNQLQYAATDAAILLPLYKTLKSRLQQARLMQTAKIEFACLPAVAQMELTGIYLDVKKWENMAQHLKQQQAECLTEINQQLKRPTPQQISLLPEFTETINPRSPQQVKAALNAQNIQVPSTHAQDLIPLSKDYPILQTLLEYRSLATRISTFAERFPTHIHPVTGRIHANWFQIGARSGRFSCREPNLQNIPRNRETRCCFSAPTSKALIKADYSQIELRIMAKVSGDQRMIQAYQQGEDLHRLTAAFVFGKNIQSVTPEERRLGKIINFGLIYGMGARKFRNTAAKDHGVDMTLKEANEFRCKFFISYPGVKVYHDKVRKKWSRGKRESRTLGGRRRVWGKQQKPRLNEMINNPIQGTNSDITKLALGLGYRCFAETEVKMVAVVHDEIVLETPLEMADWAMKELKRCMVMAGKYFIKPIPVEVEIKAVQSWGG